MSSARLFDALAIPSEARVDQRVPKKLLSEQGAATATDRRNIQDGVEELRWLAALKPSNIGVPAYRDEVREYLEIAVLSVAMRPSAKGARLTELIHRAIPYPVPELSGYKSNRFNWLEQGGSGSCDFDTLNASKIGVFSKSVRLRICKIALRLRSTPSSFLTMATST